MRTGKEYLQSVRDMKLPLYIDGGKVDSAMDHPSVQAAAEAVAFTYDLACEPAYRDKVITTSHLSGEPVPIFQHVPQNADELVAKVNVTRYCNR